MKGVVPQNENASGIPRVKLVLLGDSVKFPTSGSTCKIVHPSTVERLAGANKKSRDLPFGAGSGQVLPGAAVCARGV